jgi:O-antigen/teichoic acid export membrane protein
MVLVGPLFIQVAYGVAYAGAIELLPILSAVIWLHTISFSLAAILTAQNLQKQRLIPQAAAAVVNLGLNLALLQRYGLIAVAWSFVVSEIILVAGYWRLYRGAAARFVHRTQEVDP